MKKVKITILTPVRLDGITRSAGEFAELDDSLFNRWRELGYCEAFKDPVPDADPDSDPEMDKDPEPEPESDKEPELKLLGGGYYEMPDGSKIKGKTAALNALKDFNI